MNREKIRAIRAAAAADNFDAWCSGLGYGLALGLGLSLLFYWCCT